jgi:hypothetical protein
MDIRYMKKQFPCELYVWISRYCPPKKSWDPENTPVYLEMIVQGTDATNSSVKEIVEILLFRYESVVQHLDSR